MFGPICDALTITSRKVSAKVKKRPPKAGQDRRRKGILIEADRFEQITTANIVAFVSGQKTSRGLAAKTANRYREILVRLFNWAMTQQGVRMPNEKNPTVAVARYKESAPEIVFLSLDQIAVQLNGLTDNLQLQVMVAVLIFAGLRREELTWLTRDDLDFGTGTHGIIRVRAKSVGDEFWQPKTKRNRAVPVSSMLRHYPLVFDLADRWLTLPSGHFIRGCGFVPDYRPLLAALRTSRQTFFKWTCLMRVLYFSVSSTISF